MMHDWCWSIVTLVVLLRSHSDALTCDRGSLNNYALIVVPVDPNTGDAISNPAGCFVSNGLLTCTSNGPFIDGDTGLVDNYTSAGVHAWNRMSQSVTIRYRYTTAVQIRQISLFFYNSPSAGIGLPDITLSADGNELDYFISNNEELSQADINRRHNVILSLVSIPTATTIYSIVFTFAEDSNINRLILSELNLCMTPSTILAPRVAPSIVLPSLITRDANDVSPDLNLTCTVSGEGRFRWEWTGPGGITPSNVQLYDLTRTSTASFTGIRGGGDGFQCRATYSPVIPSRTNVPAFAMSASQDVSVQLESSMVSLNSSSVSAALLEEVSLACEVFGYFGADIPSVIWRHNNIDLKNDDPFFNITTSDGTRLIQNGGDSPIPSVVSILNIFLNDSSEFGQYLCIGQDDSRSMTITQPEPPSDETTVTTSTTLSSSSSTSNLTSGSSNDKFTLTTTTIIIIGSVIGALSLLIIVVIIVIIILRRKHSAKRLNLTSTRRKDSLDYEGEPFYQEVPKPAPPPLPDRFPNKDADIEAYATIDNIREQHNGHIQMKELGQKQPQIAVHSTKTDNSANGADHLKFLEKNPLYASSDNIDNNTTKMTNRSGSIPSLDILTDSPHGSQLNIYANPSRVAPPVPSRDFRSNTPEDAIYSEPDLDPAVFHSGSAVPVVSSVPLPSEDDSLPCFSIYADPQPLLRIEGPKEIRPENIREEKNLGFGQFGKVLLAETIGLSLKDLRLDESNTNTNISVQVAVKKLKPSPENHIKEAFEKEIKFMSRLRCDNVVRLLAICSTGDPFIVMEYMENGDLNQFLQKRKLASTIESISSKKELTRSQLAYISLQIASGMKYLATFNFIHRDLATRNCLVGSNLVVKIADFGMSRSLYSCSYYRISGRAMLPIRWMANECFYGKFSEKTDIWAFGVTMWEIFTFAREQPYHDMSDQEVIDDAIKGPDRMVPNRPAACPSELYEIMRSCWIDDINERASFQKVYSDLESVNNLNSNSQTYINIY